MNFYSTYILEKSSVGHLVHGLGNLIVKVRYTIYRIKIFTFENADLGSYLTQPLVVIVIA